MKTISRFFAATVFAGLLAPFSHAGISGSEAATVCKAEVQSHYAQGDVLPRVKLKGIYGNNAAPKVRVQVLPEGENAFLVLCQLDGRSGKLVSIEPRRKDPAIAAATN
jgi:hypothetical protein